ncbi:MAG: GDP-mannose 4,6-dehydratase [Candidatus Woesebacteria bacterium]|jgi:nucleoside-diphosphate-sugar epimerase
MKNFFKDKNVLVTGAAGFIGYHLCTNLLELEATVTGVDNFITGRNLIKSNHDKNFQFIEADVNTPLKNYLPSKSRFDLILHFASPASPPRYQAHPRETYLVNSLATDMLLAYLKETNPQARFLFASTSEIYGDPKEHPQKESYWGNVNPNGPRSCYDESKRLGETICGVYDRDFEMDVRIVRIFNTFGPRMDPDDGRVIPNFIKQALNDQPLTIYGDGLQTRSYCYINDLVRGILSFATIENLKGETINLGNPKEMTVLETAKIILQQIRPQAKDNFVFKDLPKDDPTRRRPDISKAKHLLNWEPEVDFEIGLVKTIEYFKTIKIL